MGMGIVVKVEEGVLWLVNGIIFGYVGFNVGFLVSNFDIIV